ncbi:MAG: 3-phosphoserine/phosphohydroxythreonine transaminase [Alicyclobacillus sp.]|nr:3-phosphoserine/phosphohydroxythreonine transaminase [Alicyclobacillus sp.]
MRDRKDVHNFNAGPAALPQRVLEEAQAELLNFAGSGMSVMELSHRSKLYESVQEDAEARLRQLLNIPDEYDVLFLQGGASLQFAMVPMNFLKPGSVAGYVRTGSWADKALKEARLLGETKVVASGEATGFRALPDPTSLDLEGIDAYVHLTSNETIGGIQWQTFPDTGSIPLVADMSSDILSRPFDVGQFDLIYAGAQKNLGPSGVTVVIVRKRWLESANTELPTMLRYDTFAKNQSLYNTPPTFAIYLLGLTLKWAEDQGGVAALAHINEAKAAAVYDAIDASAGFYTGFAEKNSRSRMNVTFTLPTPELEKQFLAEASDAGFVGLAGHRSVGGCRASLYNAVSQASCDALAAFMRDFARRNG